MKKEGSVLSSCIMPFRTIRSPLCGSGSGGIIIIAVIMVMDKNIVNGYY
jgi:hypothetical protein